MIEIEDSKVERMSGYAEKMLKYGGKLMQCIEELSEGSGMGQRDDGYDDYDEYDDMGQRGGFGNPGGYGGGYGDRYWGGAVGPPPGVARKGSHSKYPFF